ncbi:hypothetical protein JHK84_034355 [Glycine max]|nr:hypothetical protein JHK84_034355 [Glycine max]
MPAAKNLKELGTLEPSTDPRECTVQYISMSWWKILLSECRTLVTHYDHSIKAENRNARDWNQRNGTQTETGFWHFKSGDGVPRGSLGDPRRQHKVPISGHDSTSLVHPDEPARTLQHTVEWILPTPTPYRLVEPVHVIEVTSSEEDPEEDPEELPPEPAVDALDFLEGDEDPLSEVDSPEDVMSASEADSTEDSGPGEMAISGGSSS